MARQPLEGGMDLLAQAMRKVYDETSDDAAEHASDDAKPKDNETTGHEKRQSTGR